MSMSKLDSIEEVYFYDQEAHKVIGNDKIIIPLISL